MARLTPAQLRSRYRFDWQVVQEMTGNVFHAAAYRSTSDLDRRRNAIASAAEAEQAVKYLVDFNVPTIIGRDQPLQATTTIGFDLGAGGYPFDDPASWIIGPRVPYSPHFRQGMPVCLGEIWRDAKGQMLFGQLLVHVAKLLNWDEVARGVGYVGWNGDAIAYHKKAYGHKRINPDLRYPSLPAHLTHATSEQTLSPGRRATADLFTAGPSDPALFGGSPETTRDPGHYFEPRSRGN